jgi:hypothetical protein
VAGQDSGSPIKRAGALPCTTTKKRPGLLAGVSPGLRARAALRAEQSPPPQSMHPSSQAGGLYRFPGGLLPSGAYPAIHLSNAFLPLAFPRFQVPGTVEVGSFSAPSCPASRKDGRTGSLPMRRTNHNCLQSYPRANIRGNASFKERNELPLQFNSTHKLS